MKFAFIVDKCGVDSYYVKDKKYFTYKDNKPVVSPTCQASLTPECKVGMWTYPLIFDGCFLNWKEWGDNLPDYDLETIIVAIEKDFTNYTVSKLRKKYPNALIIGMIKEIFLGNVNQYGFSPAFGSERHLNRIKFLNECDAIIQPFPDINNSPLTHLLEDCKHTPVYVPFSIDVDYIYNNFYSEEKYEKIFVYDTPTHGRRANTLEFARYISNKHNIPLITKPNSDIKLPLKDLYNLWSQSTFHFNLDPVSWFPGSQAVQVAAAGVINVGGLNDSHKQLFPDLATNDLDILDKTIENIISDPNERARIMSYAFNRVNELYGFDMVRKQIKSITG